MQTTIGISVLARSAAKYEMSTSIHTMTGDLCQVPAIKSALFAGRKQWIIRRTNFKEYLERATKNARYAGKLLKNWLSTMNGMVVFARFAELAGMNGYQARSAW